MSRSLKISAAAILLAGALAATFFLLRTARVRTKLAQVQALWQQKTGFPLEIGSWTWQGLFSLEVADVEARFPDGKL